MATPVPATRSPCGWRRPPRPAPAPWSRPSRGRRRPDRARRRRVARRPDRRRRHLRRLRRRARRGDHRRDRRASPGVTVRKVSDRTFLLHLGGKIEVIPKVPLKHRDDLSRAYTPGVARVCLAIAENPEDARRLTIKRNTVAVVTDGSAVLGLGNIGPAAALPVMEGKAALFKQFGGVDAWPVCLDTQDTDEIVVDRQGDRARSTAASTSRTSPRRAASRSRRRLRDRARHPGLPRRPARHRDRGARRADQRAARRRQASSTTCGSWSAGSAPPATRSSGCCTPQGATDIIVCDRHGAAAPPTPTHGPVPAVDRRAHQPARHAAARCAEVLAGADVFIGVSAPNLLTGADIATMADGRDRLRAGQPRPRGRPVRGRASMPRSSRPAAPTTPTRSTTCWPSPASSAGCSTPARTRSPRP